MKAMIRKPKKKISNKFCCNDCKYEFSSNSVDIKEAIVDIGRQALTLVYFACPKCNKIYRITLKDKRYEELTKDLELAKARMQKKQGSKNEELVRTLHSMVVKKHERLQNHLDNLNAKFPGTFTFVTSENNHKDKIIKYLP